MKKAFIIIGISAIIIISLLLALLETVEIDQPKPPEALQEKITVDVPVSTINIPITYRVEQLADYLNKKIVGTFLQKHLFLNSGKEEIYLTLTKKEKITVSSNGKELVCTLPLSVHATVVESSLGKTLSKLFKPVSTNLSITLATPVSLDSNWNLSTRFEIREYMWLSEPVLQLGPFKIHIKEHLDKEIRQRSSELTRMLDAEINEEVSLQPTVSDVWKDLQRPILINKRPPVVWLQFICDDIQGDIELDMKKITCLTSLKAKPLIITDTTKSHSPLPLPLFKTLDKERRSRQSDIYLYAYTSFDALNEQLNGFLRNKSFSTQGVSTRIKKIRAYASVNGLTVEVETDNVLGSSLFISGQPVFEVPTQKLRINNFDFSIESKNMLVQAGKEILQNDIKEAITSRLDINLGSVIEKVPGLVHHAVSREKAGKTISLTLDGLTIENCEITLGAEKIHIVAHVLTEADIRLKRIKTGKTITITDH